MHGAASHRGDGVMVPVLAASLSVQLSTIVPSQAVKHGPAPITEYPQEAHSPWLWPDSELSIIAIWRMNKQIEYHSVCLSPSLGKSSKLINKVLEVKI